MNDFRGELSDIWAKTATLVQAHAWPTLLLQLVHFVGNDTVSQMLQSGFHTPKVLGKTTSYIKRMLHQRGE